MQNNIAPFVKGLGTGMIAGAAALAVGKFMLQDKHDVAKGSTKMVKAVGDFMDGIHTIFK